MLTNEEVALPGALTLLDERIAEEWQARWTHSTNGRVTHKFIETTGQLGMQFDPPGYALFLLTGHGGTNEFRNRIGEVQTVQCACGAELDDWRHVLVECPHLDDLRDLRAMGVTLNGERLNVSEVLCSRDTYTEFVTFAQAAFRRRRHSEERANAGANE